MITLPTPAIPISSLARLVVANSFPFLPATEPNPIAQSATAEPMMLLSLKTALPTRL